ncbi:hypothetical protein FKM82_025727 [Ascaphus truei]
MMYLKRKAYDMTANQIPRARCIQKALCPPGGLYCSGKRRSVSQEPSLLLLEEALCLPGAISTALGGGPLFAWLALC